MKKFLFVVLLSLWGASAFAQVPQGYTMVWNDEFRESNLDTSKWWTRLIEQGGTAQQTPSNGDQQLFGEGQDGQPNHIMTGETVKLMHYPPKAPATYYSAGMLRSKAVFDLENSLGFYFEVRMRIVGGNGIHPAFWLTREARADGSVPWPPEIDIAEFALTGNPDANYNVVHTGIQTNGVAWAPATDYTGPWDAYLPFRASYTNCDCANFNGQWSYWTSPKPGWTISDWHTYALKYEPGVPGQPHVFTTYVDGQMILAGTYDWVGADSLPIMGHIVLNTEIGDHMGTENGQVPVDQTKMPGSIEVDWVRVYQKGVVPSIVGQDFMPNGG